MKRVLAAAMGLILGMAGLTAAQAGSAAQCIQAGRGLSRVVATVKNPADCCTGRMQCAQFLSTTIVAKPAGRPDHA